MERRVFIKRSLAAGAALTGSMMPVGCSRSLREQCMATAVSSDSEAGITAEERQILYCASLAPSGHNSQPWYVRVEGAGQWVVGADPDRCLPVVDPENREVLLSIGAFVENLVIAAGYYGYDAGVEVIARSRSEPDLVRVRLVPGVSGKGSLVPLARRRTLKTGLGSREITGADLKNMEAAAGGGLSYFPRGTRHALCMAEAAVENFRIQFEDTAAMAEAAKWTRLSDRAAVRFRDGLTVDGMEIHGVAGWMVRHFMGPEDVTGRAWRKKAVEKAAVQAGQGGGWLVITSEGSTILDLINAGRRFQRMALVAWEKNIGIHPMTQALEEVHGQKGIRENHAPAMIPQFMLRVGYVSQYPDPVSLRRPVDWFLLGDDF